MYTYIHIHIYIPRRESHRLIRRRLRDRMKGRRWERIGTAPRRPGGHLSRGGASSVAQRGSGHRSAAVWAARGCIKHTHCGLGSIIVDDCRLCPKAEAGRLCEVGG